jgi:hypothetical protein
MPSWLREPPTPNIESAPVAPLSPDVAPQDAADLTPLGPRADPRTFLSDDDFPQWLRELAVRREETARRSGDSNVEPAPREAVARRAPSASAATHWETAPPAATQFAPESDSASGPESEPEHEAAPADPAPAAAVAAPAPEERRHRDVWETLLLVLLFIGVIAAALWALVANGVLDIGL